MDIGRNDPCPCGSGKKYKKCCLQKDVAAAPPPLDFAYEANLVVRGKVTDKLEKLLAESIDKDELADFLQDYWSSPFLSAKETKALRAHPPSREQLEDQIPFAMRNAFDIDGRMPAEHFLDESPERFTAAELRYLRGFAGAKMTYVQLREYFPESGYTLAEDLFDGEAYRIFDKGISRTGIPHAILAARLVPLPEKAGHVFEMVSNTIVLPAQKQQLIDLLIEEARVFAAMESGKKAPATVTAAHIHALLKGDPIVFYWLDMLFRYQAAFPGKPRIATTDGEEIVFIEARYACPDPDAFIVALDAQKSFAREDGDTEISFTWLNQKRISLGAVTVDAAAGELRVKTNSRERFRKWEKKLKSIGEARFLDKHEKAFEAASSGIPDLEAPPHAFSPKEMAELRPQIEDHLAEMWLKEKIPMLGGKTPVEAAATPKGRKQLKELFDYMESQEAMLPKGFTGGGFDNEKMKKRLGLSDD